MSRSFDDGASKVLRRRVATINETRYVIAELAEAGAYMISVGHRVEGALDIERLSTCFAEVVGRHEALRTGFAISGTAVEARVHSARNFGFKHILVDEIGPGAFRDWAVPLVFDDVQPDLPETLVRLLVAEANGYWRFTVAMHHSISDGFSRGVANRELLKLYAGETLPDVGAYADFIGNAPEVAEPDIAAAIEAFPVPAPMPPDGSLSDDGDTRGLFIEREIHDLGPALRKLGKQHGASKFGVLGAVYALGLQAFSGETRLSSFFQSEGRRIVGAPNSVIGPFSNTLPLDLSFDPGMSFVDLAKAITGRVQESLMFEAAPITERIAEAGKAPSVSLNMFPPAPRIRAGDLEVGPREFLDRRTEFDLNLVWAEDSGVMRARAFYDSAKLSSDRADAFLKLQLRLIERAIEDADQSCEALLVAAYADAPAQIAARETETPTRRIHEDFFERADAQPDAPAVVTSTETVTYATLRDRALGYARALQDAGADPKRTVAILAHRRPDLVAAILGISAYGAPFVVIDTEYPWARIQAILKTADVAHAFAIEDAAQDTVTYNATFLSPADGSSDPHLAQRGAPRAIAYHLFTSGTTGEPKRISHPDTTLMRFVDWQKERLGPRPFKTMLLAGLSHDPVMRDIFLPLSSGGAVIVPHEDEIRNPSALRGLIAAEEPDTLHITPASGQLIAMGAEPDLAFPSLHFIYWGGDRVELSRVTEWRGFAPGARQFNLYGTTETPQAALIHEIADDAGSFRVPNGMPPPWNGVRVEWNDHPVSEGALGEIVVELADPVYGSRDGSADGSGGPKTTHKTGDYGFMLPGTGVQVVGRRDNQVKINSLRIELSEITGQAEQIKGVRQAVTIQLEGENRDLVVFAVADKGVTQGKVRIGLERVLPKYMVPARVVLLDSLPLTQNGKIDLAALRSWELAAASASEDLTPPQTPEEHRLVGIWEEVLGVSPIGVTTSFLDLGGDSLNAIRLMIEMERSGLPETSVQAILQGATIRDLASGAFTAGSAADSGPIAPGPLLSRSALHALRGLLVLILVAGHWMPGLVERSPALARLDTFLSPLFKMSTPGFAIIFGASLGYFKFDIFRQQPKVFHRQIWIGVVILLGAMVLLSVIDLLTAALEGRPFTWHFFFMTYYNVLGFYLLALLTTPLWFRVINQAPTIWIGAIGLIGLFILLDLGMRWALLRFEPEGLIQLIRLYATAKFSYFSLGVGALTGILIGLAVRAQPDLPLHRIFIASALGLIAAGLTWGLLVGQLESLMGQSRRVEYWKWCLYLGSVMTLAAIFWSFISSVGIRAGASGVALKLLVSIGVLALPFFVFHGLILSLKSLTEAVGIPDVLGLVIVLAFFFGLGGIAVSRVWRLYFS
ncbi:MAG: AMP-binding protein [Pseudomonadota bacterium]